MTLPRIPLSAPEISTRNRAAVASALDSGWIAPVGPELDAFEHEMAERIGVAHGVAVSSGTAALHLALVTAGVRPGTVVVTSTFTFAATANAIVHAGARPVFVDVDPATGNLDLRLFEEALAVLELAGVTVSAVLPVDIYGKSVDQDRLLDVVGPRSIPVVMDSAEAVGSRHRGRAVGSFGHAAAFSFNGNKIMTTSGGGMLMTDDVETAATARRLAAQARMPVAHYEHHEVGYNYRLSNLLAALGRSQLGDLDDMMLRRRQVRERYRDVFASVPGISILGGADDRDDNCWLTSVVVDENAPCTASDIAARLDLVGIDTRRLWKPLHLQRAFAGAPSFRTGAAESLFRNGLSLPSGSGLRSSDLDRICAALETAVRTSDVLA